MHSERRMRTSHPDPLVSGMCESSAGGSVTPGQGAAPFGSLRWPPGLSARAASRPETGVAAPLPSVFSSAPSAYKHSSKRQASQLVCVGSSRSHFS